MVGTMAEAKIAHASRIFRFKKVFVFSLICFAGAAAVFFIYLLAGFEYNRHFRYVKRTVLSDAFDPWKAGLDEERSVITFSFLSEGLARYVSKKPERKAEAVAIIEKCICLAVSEKIRHVQSLSDTGPIIFNMGSAATGLALPAAARVHDRLTLLQLRCAMMITDIIVRILPVGEVRQVTEGLLARSIRLNAF
jgi:hypothetical protein